MEIMTKYHIRHLPVVADAKVEGIISIGDVVRDIIYQQRKTIKEMEKYVTG
jgi:CBS domain-containing protein